MPIRGRMSLRVRARRVFPSLFVCAWCGVVAAATDAPAQDRGTSPPAPEARVSIVYTGRSLGALGVLRDSDENDLLIEEAARRKLPVRLATYACWRAPNITVFSPSADLSAADLRRRAPRLATGVAIEQRDARARSAAWRARSAAVVANEARARGAPVLLVDLGHRDGDLGLERSDRARVDYTALTRLGYQPFF
jgi:hypothetical protein